MAGGALIRLGLIAALLAALGGGCERAAPAPTPQDANAEEGGNAMATATFGAGCFWGVEAAFRKTEGVLDTAVGYMGGTLENPTYEEVCADRTGHTQVVQVNYDPSGIAYQGLLEVFWRIHDPTQFNRQGPDVGAQYRSVIFYHSPEQEQAARASKQALETSGRHDRPVATAIEPAATFWRAEEYHQRYLERCPGGVCPL